MSKQSNEIASMVDDEDRDVRRSRTWAGKGRRDFLIAKQHAEELGLSPKVSDGVRQLMTRYKVSPLKHMLDVLNDPGRSNAEKGWASKELLPYLHSKADNMEAEEAAKGKAKRPVLNVTKTYAAPPTAPQAALEPPKPQPTIQRTPPAPSQRAAAPKNDGPPKAFKVKKKRAK